MSCYPNQGFSDLADKITLCLEWIEFLRYYRLQSVELKLIAPERPTDENKIPFRPLLLFLAVPNFAKLWYMGMDSGEFYNNIEIA